MNLRILPPEELTDVTVSLPVSKSVQNREMIINALAGELPEIDDYSKASDDILTMAKGLNAVSGSEFNVGAAGTVMRFLTAYFATKENMEIVLDGSERMRERPIRPLVEALISMGAKIDYLGESGYPPIRIHGCKPMGGEISVRADISSQFITALMLIGPFTEKGLTIRLEGNPVSLSYLKLTAELMRRRGAEVEIEDNIIKISKGAYDKNEGTVELDWSAASYWAQIVALSAGFVSLPGLNIKSPQPDRNIAGLFLPLGVNTEKSEEFDGVDMTANPEVHSRFIADMSDNPDVTQTIAVTCALLGVPFKLTGLTTLRVKETDRLEALKNELLKIGIEVEIENYDTLLWEGKRYPVFSVPEFETYNDHRMAMSLAPVALYIPGIVIKDAEVVNKSYPEYWEDLKSAGFILEEV